MTPQLRLLIADRAPTRRGIRLALGDEVILCAEANDAEQAIAAAEREQPDLCLIGAEIAGESLTALSDLCSAVPTAAVVVLAPDGDAAGLLDAVRAGAVGYVPGSLDVAGLRRIVRAVRAHEAVIPRSMVLELVLELRRVGGRGGGLTPRESQVLELLRRGHTTAEIAQRLQISAVTVRRHVANLVDRLDVEDRSSLPEAGTTPWGGRSSAGGRVQKT